MEDNRYLLKVMTYNIHSGKDLLMTSKLTKGNILKKPFHPLKFPTYLMKPNPMIEFLRDEHAHIIGIQEINENNERGYQVNRIKNSLKMNCAFAQNVKIDDGYYGISTFTPFKIVKTKNILLPSLKEQRGLLHTVLKIGSSELHILNTHLGLNVNERIQQFEVIEEYIKSLKSPIILMGDFNTTIPKMKDCPLIDAAKVMKKEYLSTFISSSKRIDYIFLSKSIEILDYEVLPIKLSDHYPVIVKIMV